MAELMMATILERAKKRKEQESKAKEKRLAQLEKISALEEHMKQVSVC